MSDKNLATLLQYEAEFSLTREDIAQMTLSQPSTVRCWFTRARNVPDRAIRMIRLELKSRGHNVDE